MYVDFGRGKAKRGAQGREGRDVFLSGPKSERILCRIPACVNVKEFALGT